MIEGDRRRKTFFFIYRYTSCQSMHSYIHIIKNYHCPFVFFFSLFITFYHVFVFCLSVCLYFIFLHGIIYNSMNQQKVTFLL